MYNASSNELVRTKTLVKGAIIQIDATPFRRWYENHYALPLGRKKASEEVLKKSANKKRGKTVQAKVDARKKHSAVDAKLEEQFANGRLYGAFSCCRNACMNARLLIKLGITFMVLQCRMEPTTRSECNNRLRHV